MQTFKSAALYTIPELEGTLRSLHCCCCCCCCCRVVADTLLRTIGHNGKRNVGPTLLRHIPALPLMKISGNILPNRAILGRFILTACSSLSAHCRLCSSAGGQWLRPTSRSPLRTVSTCAARLLRAENYLEGGRWCSHTGSRTQGVRWAHATTSRSPVTAPRGPRPLRHPDRLQILSPSASSARIYPPCPCPCSIARTSCSDCMVVTCLTQPKSWDLE